MSETNEGNVENGEEDTVEDPTTVTVHLSGPPTIFLDAFDPTLVVGPKAKPPSHFIHGKHPYWKSYLNGVPDQLHDPNWNHRAIGFFDSERSKVFFYDLGHLLRNPMDPSDADFFWDPRLQPWKALKKGKKKIFNTFCSSFVA